jgi:hypothetical protein
MEYFHGFLLVSSCLDGRKDKFCFAAETAAHRQETERRPLDLSEIGLPSLILGSSATESPPTRSTRIVVVLIAHGAHSRGSPFV